MKTNQSSAPLGAIAITLALLLSAQFSTLRAQQVYRSAFDAPRPTSTPKSVLLAHPPEILNLISMRAKLAKTRYSHKRSGGGSAPLRGSENVFRKFVRLEISGTKPGVRPDLRIASVEVNYEVKTGARTGRYSESVNVADGKAAIIDTKGYLDKTGTFVTSTYGTNSVRSTKYRYHDSEIVSLKLIAKDEAGAVIYRGWWPSAPKPGRFEISPVRTLTHVDGRKIKAQVHSVVDGLVTFAVKGKIYTLSVEKLSKVDREFLGSVTVR